MKRTTIILLSALAAFMMMYGGSVLGEEGTPWLSGEYGQSGQYVQQGQKDECLLVAMNCVGEDESVIQRVDRLRIEIGKGTDVYTPAELKRLNDQLNWIYSESDNLFLSK
jgi:hypothetical protein